jgi:hypothetical protein
MQNAPLGQPIFLFVAITMLKEFGSIIVNLLQNTFRYSEEGHHKCWGIRNRAFRTQNREIVVVKRVRFWRINCEAPEAI